LFKFRDLIFVQSLLAANSRVTQVLPREEHRAWWPPTSLPAPGKPRELGASENQWLRQHCWARRHGKCNGR